MASTTRGVTDTRTVIISVIGLIMVCLLLGCLQSSRGGTMNVTVKVTRGDLQADPLGRRAEGPGRAHVTYKGTARNTGDPGFVTLKLDVRRKNGTVLGTGRTRIHLDRNEEKEFTIDFRAEIDAEVGEDWSEVLELPMRLEVEKEEPR